MIPRHVFALMGGCAGIAGLAAMAQEAPVRQQEQQLAPKAYVVGELTVTDPERYAEYARQVPPIVARYGGRYLVRGGRAEALEGDAPARIVVVEYPSVEAARAMWNSPEYRRLAAIRQRASRGSLALVEGVAPPR